MEVVCGAGVIIVMNDGREEEGEYFHVGKPIFKAGLRDHPMGCLENVCCMKVVVIRISISRKTKNSMCLMMLSWVTCGSLSQGGLTMFQGLRVEFCTC